MSSLFMAGFVFIALSRFIKNSFFMFLCLFIRKNNCLMRIAFSSSNFLRPRTSFRSMKRYFKGKTRSCLVVSLERESKRKSDEHNRLIENPAQKGLMWLTFTLYWNVKRLLITWGKFSWWKLRRDSWHRLMLSMKFYEIFHRFVCFRNFSFSFYFFFRGRSKSEWESWQEKQEEIRAVMVYKYCINNKHQAKQKKINEQTKEQEKFTLKKLENSEGFISSLFGVEEEIRVCGNINELMSHLGEVEKPNYA